MILGRELECLGIGDRGLHRVLQPAVIVRADLGEELRLLAGVVRGFDEVALGHHDRLPVPELSLQVDHRQQRLAVARSELERFLEHPKRLLAIAESVATRTEATADPDDGGLVQSVTLVDQDRLVELAGVGPVLGPKQQVCAADQCRQMRRIELVGGFVVMERLLDIAELVGTARGPVEQLAALVRIGIPLTEFTAQHLDHR